MTEITIRRARKEDKPDWLRMRLSLWVEGTARDFSEDIDVLLESGDEPVFIAVRSDGRPGGFLEGGVRKYADGCESSPVGYIEGWYVDEDLRRQGVGGMLIRAMEDWARTRGLQEMASDTWLENEASIAAHLKLGYEEQERLVHFSKKL
jgi:aminoglycoside 6'-N-acetyltransferase I